MILSLSIRNFILIDKLELDFQAGLTAITGETGAGKSILLDSILFVLGYKNINNPIKPGREDCSVSLVVQSCEAVFEFLEQNHLESANEIIIKRTQTNQGRKKFLINDQLVSNKLISEIASLLVEIHGQHNHTSLISHANNLEFLDDYGNLFEMRDKLSKIFKEWQNIQNELETSLKDEANNLKEIEYLTYLTNELEQANIAADEEEKLFNLRTELQQQDKKLQLLNEIKNLIDDSQIHQIFGKIQKIISRNNLIPEDQLLKINSDLDQAYNYFHDAEQQILQIMNHQENYYSTLEEIDERYFLIKDLSNKYQTKSTNLGKLLEDAKINLINLNEKVSNLSFLSIKQAQLKEEYFYHAKLLTNRRIDIAKILEEKIQNELKFLAMPKAIFKIIFQDVPPDTPQSKGLNKVIFSAATNPGAPILPLKDIASGGELSRIMLAIKVILAEKKVVGPTMIFDEIDTGIGGKTADILGQHLRKLSNNTQIILVTHQPQIASKANVQISVIKTQLTNETNVIIKPLTDEERVVEIARMIAGSLTSEEAFSLAKTLLNS